MVEWRKVAHHVRRVGETDGRTDHLNKKNEKWSLIQMADIGGLDTDRRYGTKEPQRWRRRRHIAHICIVGGVGGGRRAASSTWRSAHDGKRSPKMRNLTVHR